MTQGRITKLPLEAPPLAGGEDVTSPEVIGELFYLFIFRGSPEYIRSDNDPEFIAKAGRRWLNDLEVTALFIELESTGENGYVESFNGKLRD